MRAMTNFGFQGYDNVISLGINGKMTEPAAAMGLASLDALDQFIQKNLQNYQLYRQELANIPGVKLIAYDETERNNYQYIIAEIDGRQSILNRDQINEILHAENVLSRRYFYPGCHLMEPYRSLYPEANDRLIYTNQLTARTLSLPNGTAVTEEDIRGICQIIRMAIENGNEVAHRLTLHS
jgi:dTDP-4-amino-4,6-dideoxygalactose transaminase